jgi:N-acetyl-anhydromuramyl-L-alanine amidase AmpD
LTVLQNIGINSLKSRMKPLEKSANSVKEYKIQWILGHDDISPGKRDSGPLFPMNELQASVLGREIN